MSDDDLVIVERLAPVDDSSLRILIESPVVDDLFAAITSSTSIRGHDGSNHARPGKRALGLHQRSAVALVVASAAAAVLVIGLLVSTGSAPSGQAPAAVGRWQLAGDLSGWSVSSPLLEMGGLSCPDATTCYVTGPSGAVSSGLIPIDSLWVSRDGGVTWSGPNVLASQITFTTPLACSSDDDCVAGGKLPGPTGNESAILLETANAGQTWSQVAVPPGVGLLHAISCPTATNCFALANSSGIASALDIDPHYGTSAQPSTFLATTDGGHTWSTSTLPPNDTISLLNCPAVTSCVAAGEQFAPAPSEAPATGVVLTTTDSGRTWMASTSSREISSPTALACPTASDCFVVGSQTVTKASPASNYCTPNASCIGPAGPTVPVTTSQFYQSTDGGMTWLAVPFPASPPSIDVHQLSCPSTYECWVSGTDGVPYSASGPGGGVSSGNSPIVLTTDDAGQTWTTMTPPDAATPGNSFATPQDLAALQCPTVSNCVALTIGVPGLLPALVFVYGSRTP